ncbi:hypothetical protein [Amycolatopsis methanolica]|uniref:Uncharacterized protein n=1 Tax=Amycolatopsis methanolica 239 TaxID=1068978 RepID=A0A076MML2_AMYME|nr:hypothetical protein [Amycolatopsis methanolica]AIJ20226.1 hypothetical protein AMETH_0134 [Amycolatopsis methanolica 239]
MSDNSGDVATQVANVFGGEQQLNTMNTDAKRMLADAQAGRWAVDEETGTHLRRAVTQMQTRLNEVGQRVHLLQRAPKFGNDEYAQRAAAHFLSAMDSDDQSLVQVFVTARDTLETLRQAIETAISKYDASDEAATKALNTLRNQEPR